ncbi:sensor histidine kinase [Putridiphycobacter roseus]|uniref:histidine kinase n=1 Tax=Putridiphycobacter roseus TaxID=2219161 RepID=A0A2W1N277_9FLAO|nr:ATP-binding protein [Putridiphycobacter roseus]PZE18749.1 sensor histidine kinase [Putridiphycobacter roseus]
MKEEDFDSSTLSKDLAERVKELECLYNISRIAIIHKNDLNKALQLIVEEIPSGWQYPQMVKAYLRYGDTEIGIRPKQEKCQSVLFEFGQGLVGELFVYYQQSNQTEIPEVFLIEEQALLNQIGYEILSLIELDLTKQQEVMIKDKLRFNDRLNLLGELTAGIAHELNTPLGNIIGYAELLQKGETDSLKKNDVEKVLKSAKHAREIVKKLMFFSCEMPSQFKKNDLNKLVKECLDLLKIQLNEKGINVTVDLEEDVPKISLDAVQFTQVIFNIVLNAIDAMRANGNLRIKTSKEQNNIKLEIADNGKGIPSHEIGRLFQPFYTNKSQNGTGLGLAVSHGIVQAHKGTIEVESEVDKGTLFTIILPCI